MKTKLYDVMDMAKPRNKMHDYVVENWKPLYVGDPVLQYMAREFFNKEHCCWLVQLISATRRHRRLHGRS